VESMLARQKKKEHEVKNEEEYECMVYVLKACKWERKEEMILEGLK